MIRDDVQRHVLLRMLAALDARDLLGARENPVEQVAVVVRGYALDHRGQSFEPRAGVDRGLRQRRHLPGGVAVELHEHQIPDLEPAPAAASGIALRVRAARIAAEIDVDLGARTAGARLAHRPEVLGLVETDHLVGRQADALAPEIVRLVVLAEHRNHEPFGSDAEILRHELPGVLDRFALEVVAEREVAEHLEEGVVARRAADVLEIVVLARHAHALLRRGRARVGPRLLAEERALEGNHPRVREEQGRIALGHERRARHAAMAAGLEEAQEGLADLARGERHAVSSPSRGQGKRKP